MGRVLSSPNDCGREKGPGRPFTFLIVAQESFNPKRKGGVFKGKLGSHLSRILSLGSHAKWGWAGWLQVPLLKLHF